jgi:alkylhydroperoxidase family enzyme
MARIPLLDPTDPATPPTARKILEEAGRSRGRLINLYRALANRPEAAAALLPLIQTVYRQGSTLEPRHGELAYMTATAVNNCFY